MPHYPRLVLAFIVIMAITTVSAALPQVLSATATCRDNEKCIFDHARMDVNLTLTNNSSAPVGVPLEFLQQTGARCALVDNETQKVIPLCAFPPADLSLRNKFTSVAPGESIRMEERLSPSAIRGLREWMLDLTTRYTTHVPVKFEVIKLPVRQSASTSFRIIGRDRAELDDK